MKNGGAKILLLALLGLGFCIVNPPQSLADSSGGIAGEEKASRPATKKDLVGTWELVSVRPIHDAKDPVFFPYQRYVFNGDASMKYMVSKMPFTKEWLDKFVKQPREIDYRVDEKGVLSLIWQTKPHQESAICAYVLKDIPAELLAKVSAEKQKGLPKKGDLTLSFLNGQGKVAYQKVLTRVG